MSTCLSHPTKQPMVVLREWQLIFCEKNKTAALLLSFFEYWHNIKIEIVKKNQENNRVAKQHGDEGVHDVSLLQWHSANDLKKGILGLASTNTISDALQLLVTKGVISVHKNPNPNYRFDHRKFFQFYPNVCQQWLFTHYPEQYTGQLANDLATSFSEQSSVSDATKMPDLSMLTDRAIKTDKRELQAQQARVVTEREDNKKVTKSAEPLETADLSVLTDRDVNIGDSIVKTDNSTVNIDRTISETTTEIINRDLKNNDHKNAIAKIAQLIQLHGLTSRQYTNDSVSHLAQQIGVSSDAFIQLSEAFNCATRQKGLGGYHLNYALAIYQQQQPSIPVTDSEVSLANSDDTPSAVMTPTGHVAKQLFGENGTLGEVR